MADLKCVNCGSTNWVTDHVRGDEICDDCGAVQDTCMLTGSMFENRTIAVDSHFSGLPSTTLVIPSPAPQQGEKRKKLKTGLADAQQKLVAVSVTLTDQHLQLFFTKIRDFVTQLELSSRVETTAKDIITRYEKSKGHHRRILDVQTGALAAIDLACGQLQLGKPLIDILISLRHIGCQDLPSERDIWAARRKIVEELPDVESTLRSEDVISNFCEELQVKWSVRKVALHIHDRIKPLVEGKSANTVAGGCILLAGEALEDESIDRTAVQETCLAAATTLQNFCKIGHRHWGTIVPTAAELHELSKTN